MAILLVPLFALSETMISDLKEIIGNTFLSKVVVAQPVSSLPEESYAKAREQYDAAKVVLFISKLYSDYDVTKIIAVCNADIFVGELDFVFGVAQKGGRVSLISLYRLDPRFYGKESVYDRLKERAAKEAIHELGHCCGLDHCKKNSCVMAFSKDVVSVDTKSRFFCEDCRDSIRNAL